MTLTKVDASTWEDLVKNAKEPVLVCFSTHNCMPCRTIKPYLEDLVTDLEGVSVLVLQIEDSMDLAKEHGVRAAPTLKIFIEGDSVATTVGSMSKKDLYEFVETRAANSSEPEQSP